MVQDWFRDAKLGIFIHWGIYAVKGIGESWSFFNGQISYDDYMGQLHGFTADRYDPEAWAKLIKKSGARYSVLTTKHHDGVALWDTKQNDLSVPKKTPAARDVLTPWVDAIRAEGLKVGLYYSHLDWSHPDYASIHHDNGSPFSHTKGPTDQEAWQRFLAFHRGQLEELCSEFGKVDLLWFDGDWERDAVTWKMEELREQLLAWQPETIMNSRMLGYGDYLTPEQGVPIIRPEGPWEFCVTMNDSWGYQGRDTNYKSSGEIIRMFCDCVGQGGNMLLDIGPKADGTIPEEQVERLEELGAWLDRNGAGVYATIGGLPFGHFNGPTTLSKDKKTLWLFQSGDPGDTIPIKGIQTEIKKISVLGTGQVLSHRKLGGAEWNRIPGVVWIERPTEFDKHVTVIQVDLAEEIELYRGKGEPVSVN